MKLRERTPSGATVNHYPTASVASVRSAFHKLSFSVLVASLLLAACAGQGDSESLAAVEGTTTSTPAPEDPTTTSISAAAPTTTEIEAVDGDQPSAPPTTETEGLAAELQPAVASGDLECQRLEDFGDDAPNRWVVVNDGVMGGRSMGELNEDGGVVRFSGNISTNGGGFSLIRTSTLRDASLADALASAEYLRFRVRSANGRGYELIAEDSTSPAQVMHFAQIPVDDTGAWTEVDVPLGDLEARAFGNPRINVAPFNLAEVTSIGIILADGVDGPFSLEADRIDVCSSSS